MDSVAVYGYPQMVEAAGVEPASEDLLQKDSPSADSSLIFLCITRVSNSYRVSPLTPSAMANHRVRLPANLKPGYSSRHLAGLLPKLRQLVRNYFRRLFFNRPFLRCVIHQRLATLSSKSPSKPFSPPYLLRLKLY